MSKSFPLENCLGARWDTWWFLPVRELKGRGFFLQSSDSLAFPALLLLPEGAPKRRLQIQSWALSPVNRVAPATLMLQGKGRGREEELEIPRCQGRDNLPRPSSERQFEGATSILPWNEGCDLAYPTFWSRRGLFPWQQQCSRASLADHSRQPRSWEQRCGCRGYAGLSYPELK